MAATPADLVDLIRRLEAATVKIEHYATRSGTLAAAAPASAASAPAPSAAATTAAATAPIELSKAAQAFVDSVLDDALADFLALSATLGGLVHDQAKHIATALQHTKLLIHLAASTKKPADWPAGTLSTQAIAPIRDAIQAAFTHLTAVADGVPAFGWVVVDPKPGPYVTELKDAAQFYVNRVVKEFKEKPGDEGETNVKWANAWTKVLAAVLAHVKQWHTTGLNWSKDAGAVDLSVSIKSLAAASASASAAPAASAPAAAPAAAPKAGGPPPPPPGPPPPPPVLDTPASGSAGGADDSRNALFAALNVGSNITAGLKKVDKSQMVHKNPELRASGVVKAVDKPTTTVAAPAAKVVKPPKFELQGNKWVIENYVGKRDLIVEDTNIKTVVYVFGCTDCAVQVKGKVNSVTVDNCKKSALLIDSVVSTVDIVNGKSIQLQVTGAVPTIAIDNSDGTTLYLAKETLDAEILTAKSSEINLMLPPEKDGGDYRESPLPEQFKTTVDKATCAIRTVPVEHKG
ncbi:adenylate cyclase associated N terminal-domain-containing protein [Catenaria anguillulae PL171]|uniref:Adenylate cyclase associated N terminal-domain-containing protein n=1 Tax=Catenaria anguillulae PL171 TaxID=765915 RepID=A0A1Y2H8W8_9FUNG|nr:adenylate cyclase associated N terminal-domain-containing protein [Catenaria anguillulae PL171]